MYLKNIVFSFYQIFKHFVAINTLILNNSLTHLSFFLHSFNDFPGIWIWS